MKKLMQKARRSGQSLVEYGLVLALIAIVAILVVKAVGTKTASAFDNIQSQDDVARHCDHHAADSQFIVV